MSFNIDDPLAGILSDGSDDSFFDDDALGKKKQHKKGASAADKKNTLFDLEGVVQSQDDLLNWQQNSDIKKGSFLDDHKTETKQESRKPISPAVSKPILRKNSLKTQPNDSKHKALFDIKDIGKSPVKNKTGKSIDRLDENGKSSQSLLDDILGGPSSKSVGSSNTMKPITISKSQEFDFDSILSKADGEQNASSNKIDLQKKNAVDKVKDLSQTKKTKPSEDWLGIFKVKDEENDEDEVDMPSWLVTNGSKKKKPSKESESRVKLQIASKEELKPDPQTVEITEKVVKEEDSSDLPKLVSQQNILDIPEQDVTLQGAALCMQQQESQLMVALQLKAQDEKLAAMQSRQKDSQRVQREAAIANHEQLDSMLRKQAEHRLQMQRIISAHQERITQRIKALLGTSNVDIEETDCVIDEEENVERKEGPHAKEKRQLLQLVQSLQENHDKEIDLMETSYRRQLAFLEVSFTQAEERMKEESDKLVKFYTEKINWLDEHHQLYKKMAEDNISSLTERHKTENSLLREQHLENIKVLQEHHAALMEHIRNSVKQEQVLIKDSAAFSTDLHELLTSVKECNLKSDQLYEKVEQLSNNTQQDSDRSLRMRENQISDMLQQMKTDRDNFEKEKVERKEIVNMLEARLRQMTMMVEEESASLRQKKMEFEFEKATFTKQSEFAKNVLKKQDEDLKALKEDVQKEYQDKIAKVDEEKAKAIKDSALVAKEKASIQNLKLELEKTKAELQAQLEELAEERTKINSDKQELHIEEQRIVSKSRDLEMLAKTAIERQSQADKKYSEAEFLQRKYEDRIRRIQEHVVSLNGREKQIAKEKVSLSRERLSLHNERKEIEGRQQCSLCRSTQYNMEHMYRDPGTFLNVPVSRDYGNMSSPINVIEHEMAQLIGRANFRPRANNFNDIEDRAEDSQLQVEPGVFKEYMDPKLMMLRLDVQQVISHLDLNKKNETEKHGDYE